MHSAIRRLKTGTCLLSLVAVQFIGTGQAFAQTADGISHWRVDKNSRLGTPIQSEIAGLSKAAVIDKLGKPDAEAPPFNMAQAFQSGPQPETLYYAAPKMGVPWFVVAIELGKNETESRSYITAQNPYLLGLWALFAIGASVILIAQRKRELAAALKESSAANPSVAA